MPYGGDAGPGSVRASRQARPVDDVAAFYRARDNRPLWITAGALRPEADTVAALLADAGRDGLEPSRYLDPRLTDAIADARAGDRRALMRAERLLSQAYARYVLDLKRPVAAVDVAFAEPGLAPPASARAVLEAAASAPDLDAHLQGVRRMHPLFQDLRVALAEHRARWAALPRTPVSAGPSLKPGGRSARVRQLRARLGVSPGERYDAALGKAVKAFQQAHGLTPSGVADGETVAALNADPADLERLILANMERVRALPADPGARYVLVDAASARLWMYEDGKPQGSMKVVVGSAANQTPLMAGMIRYAVLRPYWNIPEDLVRDRFAPRVLRDGLGVLEQEGMEVLSDWSDNPRVVDPARVDWAAVAAGRYGLRVRQKPGPENMMGNIKFMLPNDLGIYLHDTPNRAAFTWPERTISAGCVRVEDATRLAKWLFGRAPATKTARPEQRADMPAPVPVYIAYLTAAPRPGGGLTLHKDVYSRDATLMAEMSRRLQPAPIQSARAEAPGLQVR